MAEQKTNVTELQTTSRKGFDITPTTFDQAFQFAEMAADSDMVPKDFKGKPGNCLIAMQMGSELGIPPLQALQNIAVVNGRPSVYGDLLPAIARGHHSFEYMTESFDDQTMTAICKGKRKNEPEEVRTFSKVDAEKAGLWGKSGPWTQYPKRMLQMRARGFLVRDLWPDALRGVAVVEDIIDIDPKDYSEVKTAATERPKTETVEYITEQQGLELDALIRDNGLDMQKFLDHIGVEDLEYLPASRFEKSKNLIHTTIKAKQESQSNGAE